MGRPTLEELAEDAFAYLPPQPPGRLIEQEDVVLRLNPIPIPEGSLVLRPRLRAADAGSRLEQVRQWLRDDGRSACLWFVSFSFVSGEVIGFVGPNATPGDLGAQLLERGLTPYEKDPVFAGMTLDSEPPPVDGVEIRAVRTLEDLEVFARTARDGWEMPETWLLSVNNKVK